MPPSALGLVVMLALVVAATSAQAQATTGRQLWVIAEGQAEVTDRLRFDLGQQVRLDEATGFDQTFTELGLRYRVAKPFRVGAFYRFIVLDGETRHRVGGDGEAQVGVGIAKVAYRLRLQHTTRDNGGRTALRNRLKVTVDAPHRLAPFAAVELIHVLEKSELREARVYVGVDWAAGKRIELTAFYLYQQELNVNDPETNHILGLGLSWRMRLAPGAKAKKERKDKPGS